MRRCERCGRTVWWHRVYKTKAGVRAFCDGPQRRQKRVEALDDEADDAWDRLHIRREGKQGSLWSVILVVVLLLTWAGGTARAHESQHVSLNLCGLLPSDMPDCESVIAQINEDRLYVWQQTVSTSSAAYRGMGTNWEQWRPLVSTYWPADTVDRAVCLIQHESGGNPYAWNTESTASGLFQIMYSVWSDIFDLTSREDLDDPRTNVQLAYQIYLRQSYGAWSPHNRGLCHE